MKIDQLIEHNIHKMWLGSKSQTFLRISLDQRYKMLYSLFFLYVQVEVNQNTKIKVLTTCYDLI